MSHFAVKKLTQSDLTFFECQFRRQTVSNQKSIKFDADVFAKQMFPYIRIIPAVERIRLLVNLQIYGPGRRRTPDNKTRMITAAGRYQKYWELNGECIPDSLRNPSRYQKLAAGDLAVFAFEESRFQPIPASIKMCLLSHSERGDASALSELTVQLANRRMVQLTTEAVAAICDTFREFHPIQHLLSLS